MFYAKIHRATVTQADLHYVGSITIDQDLLEAAGIMPHEKVDIYDVTNGNRISTYTIPGPPGSGIIGMNGAAAHKINVGDVIIIAAYGWCEKEEALALQPTVVLVGDNNEIVEVRRGPHGGPA